MNPLLKSILRTFKDVQYNDKSGEAHLSCPRCGREDFFFNIRKKVGLCFHAKCKWAPNLAQFKSYLKRYDEASAEISDLPLSAPSSSEIFLPRQSKRLITRSKGKFLSSNLRVSQEVAKRGISIEKQFIFGLHITEDRIIIPVYENNKLVNYVSRFMWWLPVENKHRYLYAPDVKTNQYLFNWDKAKQWDRLCLVENTFNSVAYDSLKVTTNFGSSLSETQIEKISKSRAESIVLLWDCGAEANAEKAVKKLRAAGIPSCFIKITGQPDNYNVEIIKYWIREGHVVAKRGRELFFRG